MTSAAVHGAEPNGRYRNASVDARYRALADSGGPVDNLPADPTAFEYGTGTGPCACYLAERGFRVDAIDSSPAAIELETTYTDARAGGEWFNARVRHVRPDELRSELEAAGFTVIEQRGGSVLCA